MTDRRRLSAEQRRNMILTAAVSQAEAEGLISVTHETVAERCPIATSSATVRHYFAIDKDLLLAVVAAIGPQCHEEARRLGLEVS